MNLFYVPEVSGNEVKLDSEESRHLIKVLRYNSGDEVLFTDGKGFRYTSRIATADTRACTLEITAKDFSAAPVPKLYMAVAPTKNIDRFEWFLEKAVEIGVSSIIPILCEHSERDVIKADRLEKVMIAAMKQSLGCWLPELWSIKSYKDTLKLFPEAQHYIAQDAGSEFLKDELQNGKDALILIGPEGDFSSAEVKQATDAGFKQVSLGNSRLRTETAGLVAVAAFSFCNLGK